jgi:pimeloyl-ACP methyl ester carboxylesterase
MARYLLLHAFPFDSSMWDDVSQDLRARGHVVVTPDLRGFGKVPLGEVDPDMEALVEDVIALLGDEPRVIVGCSMGGYVALGLARRRPDLVEALVLIDTKATPDDDAARANRERIASLAESGGDWSAGMIDALLGQTTRESGSAAVTYVIDVLRSAPRPTVAWAQRAMAGRPDSRPTLAALEAPVLVVVGEEDVMSPMDEQQRILAVTPGARLVVIPKSGHLTPIEAPGAVAEALAECAT